MLVDGTRLPDWPLHPIPHLGDDCRTATPPDFQTLRTACRGRSSSDLPDRGAAVTLRKRVWRPLDSAPSAAHRCPAHSLSLNRSPWSKANLGRQSHCFTAKGNRRDGA